MELRKIFDTIPGQFDRYRPKYSGKVVFEDTYVLYPARKPQDL